MTKDDGMKANRQKYWSEIDQDEKIKRLRAELKRYMRQLDDLHYDVRRLKEHRHSSDGAPAVPFERPGYEGRTIRHEKDGDDVYF